MRGEKEIKEKLESKEAVRKAMGMDNAPLDYEMSIFKWVLEGKPRYTWEEWVKKVKQGLEKKQSWARLVFREFPSSPRYSVAELEKLSDRFTTDAINSCQAGWAFTDSPHTEWWKDFVGFLKDKKKVEEILCRK